MASIRHPIALRLSINASSARVPMSRILLIIVDEFLQRFFNTSKTAINNAFNTDYSTVNTAPTIYFYC